MAKPLQQSGLTRNEFLQNLITSGLSLPAADLPDAADGQSLAQQLVERELLTPYQAEAVLAGRVDELVLGNYEIMDRLGAGGMGTVFKARHRRMRRVVALKVLSPEVARTDSFARRFQREVETIARLTHPNIVMAFDADEGKSGPFLVMEFVNGRDLSHEVAHGGPLKVSDAIDRILQSARGLAYAHSQGIVHRDIKPGNLLRDTEGIVKVADLGLARLNDPDATHGNTALTQAGMVVGTPEYMAPEQAVDSGEIDHRADIYSLGCALHFLLTGKPPFQASVILAVLLKHRDDPIPSLRAGRPDVPVELEAIFKRMLAKEPADRYKTMTDVVKVLESLQTRVRPMPAAIAVAPIPPASAGTLSSETSTFNAPGADTSGFALGTAPVSTPTAARMRVLLVEPSRTQAGIIRRYLQNLNIDVVQAPTSGAEALKLAKAGGVDAVLCSMQLGDMTGADLAHDLLASPECAGIGIVVATSESDADEGHPLPASPRVVMMHKPFDSQRLASALAQATA